jgi:hypothetical protein
MITNAGICNPARRAETIRDEVTERGLDLKAAPVTGHDLHADRSPTVNCPMWTPRRRRPRPAAPSRAAATACT